MGMLSCNQYSVYDNKKGAIRVKPIKLKDYTKVLSIRGVFFEDFTRSVNNWENLMNIPQKMGLKLKYGERVIDTAIRNGHKHSW